MARDLGIELSQFVNGSAQPAELLVENFLGHWMKTPYVLNFCFEKSANTVNISNLRVSDLMTLEIPIPPLDEQKRIAARLDEQISHIEQARQAVNEQLGLLTKLVNSYFRESLESKTTKMHLSDCMVEVKKGVG